MQVRTLSRDRIYLFPEEKRGGRHYLSALPPQGG